jgi:hypothetical protein
MRARDFIGAMCVTGACVRVLCVRVG